MDELTNNPAPAAAPAPAAEATPAAASMPTSSSSSESVPEILKNLNWTEVLFWVLGSAALFLSLIHI